MNLFRSTPASPTTPVFQSLEPRLLLSAGSDALSGLLDAGDVVAMDWNGQQVYAKPGQWLLSLDGVSGARDDQVIEAQGFLATGGQTGNGVASALSLGHMNVIRQLGQDGLFLLETPDDLQYEDVFTFASDLPGFDYIEPDFTIWVDATIPNDTMFDDLYGLHNTGQTGGTPDADIDAPEAWDIHTGTGGVVVGVIDTGVDYTHPDLAGNMWHNPGEIDGDGIDNDGNGFIDDYYGWDFVNDDADPMDGHSHGTHCAGTIAGVGNNTYGVTGVGWNTQIMALKFLSDAGRGSTSDAIEALDYAAMMRNNGVNIRLTSNSWGGGDLSQALADAIQRNADADMLFIAAAGNDSTDIDNSIFGYYPAGYDNDNQITVAATDHNDDLASFSNWGADSVDLGAPGVNIVSTIPGDAFGTKNGTSMAAPHVAGVAALAWDMNPSATYQEIRDAILAGADPIPALDGLTVTGGRLNAYNTLEMMGLVIDSSSPGDGEVVTSLVTDFTVNFRDPYDPATVQATDLLVNGLVADTVTLDDADTVTFHFAVSPITAEGLQDMFIADGAVERLSDGVAMNDWPRTFRYDALRMDVVGMTPTDGSTASLPLTTVRLDLNEPVDPASVGLNDLALNMGHVTAVAMIDADTVEYTIEGLDAEIVWQINLITGALTDAVGNPSLPYSGSLELDFSTIPFPTPLQSALPAGSLIYDEAIPGIISAGADTDTFTLEVTAGQTITLLLTPDTGLQGTVELYGPLGGLLSSASAAAGGDDIVIQTIPTATTGVYTVVVRGVGASAGAYSLRTMLNAAVENEAHDGAANDTLATAQDIDPSFVDLGAGASRAAVETLVGAGEQDWYGFTLAAGDIASIAAVAAADGTFQVELYDAAGTLQAAGEDATNQVDRAILDFVATATGTYAVRVTGDGLANVIVLRNATFDLSLADPQDISSTGVVLASSRGTASSVEPDDFPAKTPLANAYDGVTLSVEGHAGNVGSVANSYASTGDRVFGHGYVEGQGYINYWNGYYEWLRADFHTPVAEFSIDIIGDDDNDPAVVRAYDADHNLLEEVSDQAQPAGQVRTVTISRPTADIAYMLASSVINQSVVLDNLVIPGVRGDEYSIHVQAGDTLTITTSTPADGTGEPGNNLDASVELYDPLDALVASDDNSAPDGRNVLLTHVAATSGEYVINIFNAAGAGDYVLNVTGHTGVVASALTVTGTDPAHGAQLGSPVPTQMTVFFSDPVLMSTVDAADLTVGGLAATGMTVVDARTIIFDLPTLDTGTHAVVIAAGAIESLGGASIGAYNGQFELDMTAPRIVSSTLTEGDIIAPGDLTVTVTFDEPMNDATIGWGDVWLSGQATGVKAPTSITYDPITWSLTVEYTALPADAYTLAFLSRDGRLEDAFGNGLDGEPADPLPSGDGAEGGDFVVHFLVDPSASSISGQVFNDVDASGSRDTGEEGLDGRTVELLDDAGQVIASVVTASVDVNGDTQIDPETESGLYTFTGLPQGDYQVREVIPGGWSQTSPLAASPARAFAADVVGSTVTFSEFDVADGSIINSFAGPQLLGAIGFQGMAVGPGSLFYVDANDLLTPTLWEVDADTGAVIDSDTLSLGPIQAIKGMSWLGGELFIQYLPNTIAVWNPDTDAMVRAFTVSANVSGSLTAAGNRGTLFATNTAGDLLEIDPADGSILNTVSLGLGSLDGGMAYAYSELLAVSSSFADQIRRLDPNTGASLGVLTLGVGTSSIVGLGAFATCGVVDATLAVSLGIGQSVTGQVFGVWQDGLPGDVNLSGNVDADDIDLLFASYGDNVERRFDLDGDWDADSDDVDMLIHTVLGTEYGDFNLDGQVDATDLAILEANLGQPGGWADGDANGDGLVTEADRIIWAGPPMTVTGTDPADGAMVGLVTPTQVVVFFSDSVLASSVDASDLTMDGLAATGVTVVDRLTVVFDLPSVSEGPHTVNIALGALTSMRSVPVSAYSGQFDVDVTAPRVVSSSLAEGSAVSPGDLTITLGFDEAMSASAITAGNIALVGDATGAIAPATVTYDAPTQSVTLEFSALPEDTYTLSLLSGDGRFEDTFGNGLDGEAQWPLPSGDGIAGGDFVIHFQATYTPASIAGQIFNDLDGDELREAGEEGLDGRTVELVDAATGQVVASAVTASEDLNSNGQIDPDTESGLYTFTGLSPADYVVRQIVPGGWSQTTPVVADPTRAFAIELAGAVATMIEFDVTDGSLISTLPNSLTVLSPGYQALAVGPNSLFGADANDFIAPILAELDRDTGAIIDFDTLSLGPVHVIRGMAWLGGELFIQFTPNDIAVWDPAADALIRTLTVSANVGGSLTAAADRGTLFAASSSGDLLEIDPANGAVLSTLTPSLGPLDGGLAYANGELLAIGASIGATISRLDPDTGAFLGNLTIGSGTNAVVGLAAYSTGAWTPTTHTITLAEGQSAVGLSFGAIQDGLPGDVDLDGNIDAADIDLLFAGYGSGVESRFDLNGDGNADAADVDMLIREILITEYGDINLDGQVDATDLQLLSGSYGQPAGWAGGDLSGDGLVNLTDLSIMKAFFGFQRPAAPPAPEGVEGLDANEQFCALAPTEATGELMSSQHVLTGDPAVEGAAPLPDEGQLPDTPGTATFDLADTYLLHSNPTATKTIFLDFDGHTTVGTSWNSAYTGGDPIVTPEFNFEGYDTSTTEGEMIRIQEIWEQIAEDFSPFEVDVTTEEPADLDDLIRDWSDPSDERWGVRAVLGGSSGWTGSGYYGLGYYGSFYWQSDTPVFIFTGGTGSAVNKVATVTSHEIGHALNLYHDGKGSSEYYSGHGSGETAWAPIMGSGWNKSLNQWSKGEYNNATNVQDDLAIITNGNNGAYYRPDDHGGDLLSASSLVIQSDATVFDTGIIEQNTDVDFFTFTTLAGTVTLNIDPFYRGPNLDVLATLYDSIGTVLATSNPVDYLDASFSLSLAAGTYFLSVDGTGKADPAGYTDYGSLGQYTITGNIITPGVKLTET